MKVFPIFAKLFPTFVKLFPKVFPTFPPANRVLWHTAMALIGGKPFPPTLRKSLPQKRRLALLSILVNGHICTGIVTKIAGCLLKEKNNQNASIYRDFNDSFERVDFCGDLFSFRKKKDFWLHIANVAGNYDVYKPGDSHNLNSKTVPVTPYLIAEWNIRNIRLGYTGEGKRWIGNIRVRINGR